MIPLDNCYEVNQKKILHYSIYRHWKQLCSATLLQTEKCTQRVKHIVMSSWVSWSFVTQYRFALQWVTVSGRWCDTKMLALKWTKTNWLLHNNSSSPHHPLLANCSVPSLAFVVLIFTPESQQYIVAPFIHWFFSTQFFVFDLRIWAGCFSFPG